MDSSKSDDPLEDIFGVYVLYLETLLELLDLLREFLLKLLLLLSGFVVRYPEFIFLWISVYIGSMDAFN